LGTASSIPAEVDNVWVKAPGVLELRKFDVSKLGPEDVLIRVRACAICGSDLHIYEGTHPHAPTPIAIGHELSGEVVRVGGSVQKVGVGDRVCVEPLIVCGKCHYCQRGLYNRCLKISVNYRAGQSGFTKYFKFPERWLHRIPDNLSFEEASLIEPLAVAVHNVRGAGLKMGDTAAILGAGPIGLLVLQVARAMGASTLFITDTDDYRLSLAGQLGADYTINAAKEDPVEKVRTLTDSLGVDVCFEAVGIERTFTQAIRLLKKGGMARIIGTYGKPNITFDVMQLIAGELRVSGTFGYCWDYEAAIDLASRGRVKLKPLITHVMNLDNIKEAFELLAKREKGAVKVVIKI